jgi:hypothetical protein
MIFAETQPPDNNSQGLLYIKNNSQAKPLRHLASRIPVTLTSPAKS